MPMVILFLIFLIFLSLITFTSPLNELAQILEVEFNKYATEFPPNYKKYIKTIQSTGLLKLDKFYEIELQLRLQNYHKLKPQVVMEFSSILYSNSVYFKTFSFTLENRQGGFTEFIGAARKLGRIVEIAYIEMDTISTLVPQYEKVKQSKCWNIFMLFKKCTEKEDVISRGYTMDEVNIISQALKADSYKHLRENTQNVISALETKEFVISENSPFFGSNGKYFVKMQDDGNMVLYSATPYNGFSQDRPIWSSGTFETGIRPYLLALEKSGDLCIYDNGWNLLWRSLTDGKGVAPHRLLIMNEGDMVIADKNGFVTWRTNTNGKI